LDRPLQLARELGRRDRERDPERSRRARETGEVRGAREGPPAVDAERLEDAVGIQKAAVENRDDRRLERDDRPVDRSDPAHAAASSLARWIALSSAPRASAPSLGSSGAPSRTVTRENGHANPNRSQARRSTKPRSIAPPSG